MRKLIYLFLGVLILLPIFGALGCSGSKAQMKNNPSGNIQKKEVANPNKEAPAVPEQKGVRPTQGGGEPTPPRSLAQVTPPPVPAKPEPSATPTPPAPPVPPAPSVPTAPTTQPPPAPVAPPGAPSPPPFSTPPTRSAEPRPGQGVVFNFDNADLYEVIRIMAEIMKMNYIIDPKVRGVVNIHTSGQIATEEVFSIFQTILKLNGATAVKKENLYEIVPFGDAKKLLPPVSAKEPGRAPPEMRYVIQIIPLKYIPVSEASKLVKPFLSDGADIVEHPSHNVLILGDVAPNIKKCLDIIGLFDIDIFTDMRVRIYPVLNADVTEVAKEMERIFSSFEVSTKSGRGVGITFTPITRINSLLTVSSIPNIFEKVEGWLKELDKVPAEGTKLGVFVYYCQNSKAKDLADVLKQIFVATKDKKTEFKEKVVTPEAAPRGVRPTPAPTPTPPPPPREEAAGVPEGEINIVVDEPNNALVIRAFARDYRSILETIKKLDIYPKQVLIEVLLAEITLGDSYRYGVEWSRFLSSNPPEAQSIVMGSQPPADPFNQALSPLLSGVRYTIVDLGGRVSAALSAAALDNRLNVISSPHILASNNKEAKIQVGSAQPILTNTYTTTATAGTNVVEGTIEYKDVGIILTVTPRVSDGGLVTLEISVEDSTVSETSLGNLENVPVFDKRTAKTILSILEGQTIVIGGLIQDTKNTVKSGVPLLSKIPVIGGLFGTQTYIKRKTELLILLTPHVIADIYQSNAVTQEFKDKVEGLRRELEKKMNKKKKN